MPNEPSAQLKVFGNALVEANDIVCGMAEGIDSEPFGGCGDIGLGPTIVRSWWIIATPSLTRADGNGTTFPNHTCLLI